MPACCSPSAVPDGSGRNVIAEHAGAAFPGALVAAPAETAVKASTKPIPTVVVACIVLSPCRKALSVILWQPRGEIELTAIDADRRNWVGSAFAARVRSAEGDQGFHQIGRPDQ